MSNDLTVSVIIPFYNAEAYLGAAIESVLQQTLPPFEVIVVDDASTDGSADVAASFGDALKYVAQSHAGTAAARNHGIGLSRGELIAFLDADDLWASEKLALQIDSVQADPELALIFGQIQEFFSPELDETTRLGTRINTEPTRGFHVDTLLVRRHVFEEFGVFDPALRQAEFVDWYLRAHEAGLPERVLPQVLAFRRLHSANKGRRQKEFQLEYIQALKASLDRRRAAGIA